MHYTSVQFYIIVYCVYITRQSSSMLFVYTNSRNTLVVIHSLYFAIDLMQKCFNIKRDTAYYNRYRREVFSFSSDDAFPTNASISRQLYEWVSMWLMMMSLMTIKKTYKKHKLLLKRHNCIAIKLCELNVRFSRKYVGIRLTIYSAMV